MSQIPTPFFQRIIDEVAKKDYIAFDLPQKQGLVILQQHLSPQEQVDVLQHLITTLKPTPTESPVIQEPIEPQAFDCQVTVEERTQLFKFLNP